MESLYVSRWRKSLIATLCMVMVLTTLWTVRAPQTAHAADVFDNMRQKWADVLTGGVNLDTSDTDIGNMVDQIATQAQGYWCAMEKSASRTYIWNDLTDFQSDGYDLRHTYQRLFILYPDLTSAQIADWTTAMNYFMNKEASLDVVTAVNGNGIDWLVWNTLAAIVTKDGTKLGKISSKFGGFFAYSTTGVGFYKDGSYLDHTNVAYTGSYGAIMLDGPASLLWLFEGTPYDTTDPAEANTWEKIYNAFEPIIYQA